MPDEAKRTPLHYAAEHGSAQAASLLLAHADVSVTVADEQGQTPLSIAASVGAEVSAEPVKSRNLSSRQPPDVRLIFFLLRACFFTHCQAVAQLLLEKDGSLIACSDRLGRTPLHCAALNGHVSVVSYSCDCTVRKPKIHYPVMLNFTGADDKAALRQKPSRRCR